MAGSKALGGALAALLAVEAAAQPGAGFPCDKLGDQGYRIFEQIGSPEPEAAKGPVRLKKNALLGSSRQSIESRWLTLDDTALATDGAKLPPAPVRAYRIEGERRFCTSTVRDSLFGPRGQDGNFLLRCLEDKDGDGRYEAFRPYGELVSYNMRTGKTGKPTGVEPPSRPLPRPVALVENGGAKDPNPAFAPRIVSELRVAGIGADTVSLRLASQVAMLPGKSGERFRGSEDGGAVALPLREGAATAPDGRTIALTRKGRDWYAALAGTPAAAARLQCDGSVVEIGDTFTIMSDGGMSVIARADVPKL